MRSKDACIVVNLRTGEHVLQVPALETIFETDGEMVPSTILEGLQEGEALLVEGNKNKHNIIRARCIRLL